MTAREGLSPNTHAHRATLEQQFPSQVTSCWINSCKHTQGLSVQQDTKSIHQAQGKHTNICNFHMREISCSTRYFCGTVPSLSNFSQAQGQHKWSRYHIFTTSSRMGRLLLMDRHQYLRQDGLLDHLLPYCSHSSVPEPGITTFTAVDSQRKKETKQKADEPHTLSTQSSCY